MTGWPEAAYCGLGAAARQTRSCLCDRSCRLVRLHLASTGDGGYQVLPSSRFSGCLSALHAFSNIRSTISARFWAAVGCRPRPEAKPPLRQALLVDDI